MIALESILVDIDAAAEDQPALDQAIRLAARCAARVKIVDVLLPVPPNTRHFVTAGIEGELVAHRVDRLQAAADRVQPVVVTTELLRGRPGLALVEEVMRSGHDLLMRSHGRDLAEPPGPFGAVDMELLRQCPCPVWVVGRHDPAHVPRRVLAAVHANPTDDVEQRLNATILEWGLLLRELHGAELTVLQTWTPYGASLLRSRLSQDEFGQFVGSSQLAAQDALSGFVEPFRERLAGVTVSLEQGETEEVIARIEAAEAIDVVVMGTVARTGIAGLLMGNTAEQVLRRLRGSVIAVKPPGFVSPVTR